MSSYGANWQVFGDTGTKVEAIAHGSSNTIIFNEKYARMSRPTGNPLEGATLWGYGTAAARCRPRGPARRRGGAVACSSRSSARRWITLTR